MSAATVHIVSLSRRIVELLERERGNPLSAQQIAARLSVPVFRASGELNILRKRQKISYAAPPDNAYWIEPPRDEVAA